MNFKKTLLFINLFCLFFSLSLLHSPGVSGEEIWMTWADYAKDKNPIYISHLNNNIWNQVLFSASLRFESNFSPNLAISNNHKLGLVWAARIDNSAPKIYFSSRVEKEWSPPEQITVQNSGWQSMPAVSFDDRGVPWVVWAEVVGSSTEILCSKKNWINFLILLWSVPLMIHPTFIRPSLPIQREE